MYLIGPSRVRSYGGNYYVLFIVDDFSRYTWTLFLSHKSDTISAFKKLANIIQNEKKKRRSTIVSIKSDNGKKFENDDFTYYYLENGIGHNFFALKTP